MAVLRGDAVATQEGGKTLKGDVLTAHFKDKSAPPPKPGAKPAPAESGGGGLELQRTDAFGHVVIVSSNETVTGDRGDYNAETGIATVSGSVKISREGGNQLEGGWAHVNLNTGVSKLFPTAAGAAESGQRVQGVFIPQKKDKNDKGEPQGKAGFIGNVPTPGPGGR
jgi:lipopolysaccharide export system protein LptA